MVLKEGIPAERPEQPRTRTFLAASDDETLHPPRHSRDRTMLFFFELFAILRLGFFVVVITRKYSGQSNQSYSISAAKSVSLGHLHCRSFAHFSSLPFGLDRRASCPAFNLNAIGYIL